MPDKTYYPGEQIRLQGTISSTAGVDTDSTAMTLLYEKPFGAVISVAYADLTKQTTGAYYYLVTPTSTEAGVWRYGLRSTSATVVGSSYSGRFEVLPLPFTT